MSSPRVALDYNRMLAPATAGRGVDPARLAELATTFRDIHAHVQRQRADGRLGFYDLPYDQPLLAEITRFAEGVGQAFDTVVVLGIGGSALGTRALQHALLPPRWNELGDEARAYFPRLYVLDNIDPATMAPLLERLDVRRTLVNVVSKSGATAETMAQFMILREKLRAALADDAWRGHFIFTTDPERGVLRRIAETEGIPTLPIPPAVGGRFSIFSAVGLLPAGLVGIDIAALLEGAASMEERCRSDQLADNPAGLFAALQYLAHMDCGAAIHVMMPYSDRLASCAAWFQQLWAESLGKRVDSHGNEVFRGPTPVGARGATDQHSQVQLYMEGPFDKTVAFVTPGSHDLDMAIPPAYPDLDELAYLGGHTLGELLEAERNATAAALAVRGRMNMTIELPVVSAHTIGQFLMMLQIATIYAGALYQVDPLDQPGVELGKQLTYGMLGRPGHDAPALTGADPRWVCR